MEINRVTYFFVAKEKAELDGKLRVRIRWDQKMVNFNLGFRVVHEKWNKEAQRCKKNTTHNEVSAKRINAKIQDYENKIEDVFKGFEVDENNPSPDQLRNAFNELIGKVEIVLVAKTFFDHFDDFVKERGAQNDWTPATINKMKTVKNHLLEFDNKLSFEILSEEKLGAYIEFLRDDKNMLNSTIKKQIGFLKWFLNWADTKKLITDTSYKTFNPKLKHAAQSVVYLTSDELGKIVKLKISETKNYLDRVRDVFLFCCYTSLRYSDIKNLKKSNIVNGKLNIVTIKTQDALKIPLIDKAKAILKKYEDFHDPEDHALPVISNQKMNDYVKELCKLAKIKTPVSKVHYIGNQRIETTQPKHEVVGTHTARRTFICNALSQGIPPHIVMKITGHSDFKAMQPYVDVVEEDVEEKLNGLKF